MDSLSIISIFTKNLIIILTILYGTSYSLDLSNLRKVCVFYFPPETNGTIIKPPDGYCTAVATYSNEGIHPPSESLEINSFKNGLPYVYIYDKIQTLREMKEKVHHDHVHKFMHKLNELIKNKKIDVMVFDILNVGFNYKHKYKKKFQRRLKTFFTKMKEAHPNMLFGLKINRLAEVDKSVFNAGIIDESVDFYVVRSYDYNNCLYHDHQRDMTPPLSPEEMQKNINDLQKIGYDKKKMFYTIQVVVKSWKHEHTFFPSSWSYTWTCQAKPGKKRKFCRSSLDSLYKQAKVLHDNEMPGIFIEAIDCDDYDGTCKCGCFPGAQALSDGLDGNPEDQTTIGCTSFGLLPRELHPQI